MKRCVLLSLLATAWLVGWSQVLASPLPAEDSPPSQKSTPANGTSKPDTVNIRVIRLSGQYEDYPAGTSFQPTALLLGRSGKPSSFVELCDTLDNIARDASIQMVFFDVSDPALEMNLAQLAELAEHIQKLRAAGKRTFAWLEDADTIHYAAAAPCDTVLMADLGTLDLPSLSLATLYFRDAMDLFGVRASVVRVGQYKGAVEPFTRSEMSEPLRRHYRKMLVSMNNALADRLAAERGLSLAQIRQVQSQRLFAASQALAAHLVDIVAPFGEARTKVADLVGQSVHWVMPSKPAVKPLSLFELMGKLFGGAPSSAPVKPSLAVLHLDGEIIDGEHDLPGFIVSGPTVQAINRLRANRAVRSVVVRINSPGGSVTASEAIRKALARLAAKKPVVFSMGSVAASGGYWITCVGCPIYAEPATITGSIGVFALKLSIGPLMDRIGLRLEHVALDSSATALSPDREWTPTEQEHIQGFVNEVYAAFLKRVSTSRDLPVKKVQPIAGGRVWSGAQAKDLHLIDHLGGLDAAMAQAAKEGGLSSGYPVVHRPRKKSFLDLLQSFDGSLGQGAVHAEFPAPAMQLLRRAGFDWRVPFHLFETSLEGHGPQVWALAPAQYRIR